MKQRYKPRWMADKLRSAAEFSPVIVPSRRAAGGKSHFAQKRTALQDWRYITFDDLDSLTLAQRRPDEILGISKNMVVDEVQKSALVPECG